MLLKMASVDNLSVDIVASNSKISNCPIASKYIVYQRMKAKPCLRQTLKDMHLKCARNFGAMMIEDTHTVQLYL